MAYSDVPKLVASYSIALTLFGAVASAHEAPSREAVLRRLREVEAKLTDVRGSFTGHNRASERYASNYAITMKIKSQEAIDHFDVRFHVDFAMRRSGGRPDIFLEMKTRDKVDVEQAHWLIASDGEKRYYIHDIPKAGQRLVPLVELGKDVWSRFQTECDVAFLLGLCLPHCEGTFADLVARGGQIRGPFYHDGTECTRVIITIAGKGDDGSMRYLIDLDNQKGLAIRSIVQEFAFPGSPDLVPYCRWKTTKLSHDEPSGLWLPIEAERELIGFKGEMFHFSSLSNIQVSIAASLSPSLFSPSIEDGSNVWDERTKRGYVAGRKPSRRILGFIKESAEEARRENLEINNGGPKYLGAWNRGLSLGTLLIGLGVILILFAGTWRWRSGL